MDLFSQLPDDAPVTSDELRNGSLVKRLRVLLHAYPLFLLNQSDSRRDEALRHYDTLTIALKIMDVVAERMGMEIEADREYIDFSLASLLDGMDRRAGLLPDVSRHIQIVDRVLAALHNDSDARRPFKMTYTDIDASGEVSERQLEFRLIQDAFGLDGSTVMRLTNEAVNLYFNALELDLEDSQAATEAIVHSQMCRGKFDEARRSAHYAVRQSRLYCDRLRKMLRDTQRDISRVDWAEKAPKLISEAMGHLEARLDVERNIIATASERLEALTPGTPESLAVARVVDAIQYCIETHTVLQRELMTARTTFLDSQAQQAFVSEHVSQMPDLMREVVEPLMEMPVNDVLQVIDNTLPHLMAPKIPEQLSLCFLFDGLLRPKRQLRRDWIDIEPIEPNHFSGDIMRYSEEDRTIAEHLLSSVVKQTTLSDLLAYARAQRFTRTQCEIIVLLVMQHFDIESAESPIVRVEKANTLLVDPDYYGDEVWISPFE
ncbi:MAG: hypothetical protein IJM59_00040 [Proteobacteria bacterium]|jgi:hypothetical protein|nr:hypothetical protein [Pseudomonadota bacterium]